MPDTIYQRIMDRYNKLVEIRRPWLKQWEDIARFVHVQREFIKDNSDLQNKEGRRVARNQYDISPGNYLDMLVNGFQGHMVSPSILWFDLRFSVPELQKNRIAKRWLEDTTQQLYWMLENSNFYDAIHEYIMDSGSIGTATIYTEEDVETGRFVFSTRHPIEIVISENRFGEVDTVFRRYKMSAREAKEKWGDQVLSQNLQKTASEASTMDKEEVFIHAVFPAKQMGFKSPKLGKKPYASVYLEEAATQRDKPLSESGYYENPYQVWRWDKNSTEWYGRSPAHKGLPAIIMLNSMNKDLTEASHLAVAPPYMVPAKHRRTARITPRGLNYYEDLATEEIRPILTSINYPVGLDRVQDIRSQLREVFMVDFFMLLASQEHTKTATEILEMQGEKAAVLGTAVGKFESECLDKLLERVYRMAYEAGQMPEVPDILADTEYGKEGIRIDYIGPLAQIQRRLFKSYGITHSLASIASLMGAFPTAGDVVNEVEAAKELLDAHGAPEKIKRTDEQIAAIRDARAQAIAEEQRAERMTEAAKAAGPLTKTVERGSVLDQLTQGA